MPVRLESRLHDLAQLRQQFLTGEGTLVEDGLDATVEPYPIVGLDVLGRHHDHWD
jgi:hypothetical protein